MCPTYSRKHQLQNSLVYHVYNRSNGRSFIYKDVEDFNYFRQLLKEYTKLFDSKLYHWVIMSNHYHLLLEIAAPEQLSRLMAGLNHAYTLYHHKRYDSSGFLWQGRFKAQPIQKESYLLACGRYVERNPVRAHMVTQAADYACSSARYYCLGEEDGLTTENPIYATFGTEIHKRRTSYVDYLRDFDPDAEKSFARLEYPVGDSNFVNKLIRVNGQLLPRKQGQSPKIFVA
jgi:putative transposase